MAPAAKKGKSIQQTIQGAFAGEKLRQMELQSPSPPPMSAIEQQAAQAAIKRQHHQDALHTSIVAFHRQQLHTAALVSMLVRSAASMLREHCKRMHPQQQYTRVAEDKQHQPVNGDQFDSSRPASLPRARVSARAPRALRRIPSNNDDDGDVVLPASQDSTAASVPMSEDGGADEAQFDDGARRSVSSSPLSPNKGQRKRKCVAVATPCACHCVSAPSLACCTRFAPMLTELHTSAHIFLGGIRSLRGNTDNVTGPVWTATL
jgi:hypothetical protein